jgi:hypothetical protein
MNKIKDAICLLREIFKRAAVELGLLKVDDISEEEIEKWGSAIE